MRQHLLPEQWNDNLFHTIGKDWALLSAYDPSHDEKTIGTMTVSWGGAGVLWGKNVFFCFVRPQRYTKEFIDGSDTVTLSFFDPQQYRNALTLCGKLSGRDHDKIAEAGLSVHLQNGAVCFDQARITVIGKKLYAEEITADGFFDRSILDSCYPNSDFHTVYVCEIVDIVADTENEITNG